MRIEPNWWIVAGALLLLVAVLATEVPGVHSRRTRWELARHVTLSLLLVGIGLRPVWGHSQSSRSVVEADVVIAVDRTASMGAVDVGGRTRAEAVGADIRALVSALQGARFTVVSFDDEARLELPETTDGMAVVTVASALGWRSVETGRGSDISEAAPMLTKVLGEARDAHPEAARLVYYFGDGEHTSSESPTSFESVAPLVTKATVVGYGTEEGAPMHRSRADTQKVSVDGVTALSQADPQALQRIATQMGGSYLPGPAGAAFERDGDGLPRSTTRQAGQSGGKETYWLLAIVAQLLVLFDLGITLWRWREARREARA